MELNANGTTSVKPQIVGGYFGLNLVNTDKLVFVTELNRIAKKLGIASNWLLIVMYKESTIQPGARNIQNGNLIAGGLIQFIKKTAIGLGTTLDQILRMGYLDQLKLVEKYYTPFAGKIKSYSDLYLCTFYPAALGKPDSFIFGKDSEQRALIAKQNKGLDYGNKGYITMADFKKYIYKNLPTEALQLVKPGSENNNASNLAPVEITAKPTYYIFAAILIGLGLIAYQKR